MYRLNEYRQQIKFHKDLVKHYYNSLFDNIYVHEYDSFTNIPKTIHYAWFGRGVKPEILNFCMNTWPKYLGGYSVQLWNEDNFPFEKYPFALQAYKCKKYAFVADVARLHAIYNYGGIYMDTDCEVRKSFDDLLYCGAFACYETPNLVSIGTLGAKPFHPWVASMLLWYYRLGFCDDYAEIANTRIMTKIMRWKYTNFYPNGKYTLLPNDTHIFTRDYFCPSKTDGKWDVTDNTYVIHHFSGLW